MKKGGQEEIVTPGFNRRRNVFVTLFWPLKRYVYNAFPKRRNVEFRKHLSNVLSCVIRHGFSKIILFVDHASSHKTVEVKMFVRGHPILVLKFLPKRAPNLNPVEKLVNAPLKSCVCSNRAYYNVPELEESTHQFLRCHKRVLCT